VATQWASIRDTQTLLRSGNPEFGRDNRYLKGFRTRSEKGYKTCR
jgi:hypothetical protein